MQIGDLTTLDAVKGQLELQDTVDAKDDALIQALIAAASSMVTQFCGRGFVPVRQLRRYDARGDHVDARRLDLDADLLEVNAITNGDGAAISSSAYVLRPANRYPKTRIELLVSGGLSWLYTTDWQEALQVDGWWGCHTDYARAWVDTLEVVPAGGLTSGATSVTLTDVDGLNAHGLVRFAVGGYVRLDDELIKVVGINASTNVLTIRRAQLGTTAAAHLAGAAFTGYVPVPDIEQACISLVSWLRRNAATAGEKITFLGGGTQIISNDAPSNIRDTLEAYRVTRLGGM